MHALAIHQRANNDPNSDPMEATASLTAAKSLLGALTVVLGTGAVAGVLSEKLRIPDVAVFLLIGILIGPDLFGWVDIRADSAINQIVLIFGACFILFDGGATLRFGVLKEVWITIVVIATVGVLITAAITGYAAHLVLGVPLVVAMLLGATLASTDPATLVPIFKQVRIKPRVEQTVISESAFNDAMGAILTFTVLGVAMGTTELSLGHALGELLREAGMGLLVGAAVGVTAGFLLGHHRYDVLAAFSPLVTVVGVSAAYLLADHLEGSGFMAVFVFGIIIGNRETFGFKMETLEEQQLGHFVHSTALFMRLLIFMLLGSQVSFGLMAKYWLPGLSLMVVLIFIARPATVFFCTVVDRRAKWSFNEMLFMCWTRETGVIPAALAGMLLGLKAPGAEMIASITFIAVLCTILIQAPTTRWLGARLRLLAEA